MRAGVYEPLLRRLRPGGALDLGDGARAVVAGGVVHVERTPPGPAAPAGTAG